VACSVIRELEGDASSRTDVCPEARAAAIWPSDRPADGGFFCHSSNVAPIHGSIRLRTRTEFKEAL